MESTQGKKRKNIYNVSRYVGFHARLVNSLQFCLNKSDFLDLTVICGTHKFDVHKLILSCLSPHFHNLLKQQPNGKATLVINEVSWEIMQKIITLMYSGSVKLEPNEMDDFERAATRFQIGSLSKIRSFMTEETTNNDINNNTPKRQTKPNKTFEEGKELFKNETKALSNNRAKTPTTHIKTFEDYKRKELFKIETKALSSNRAKTPTTLNKTFEDYKRKELFKIETKALSSNRAKTPTTLNKTFEDYKRKELFKNETKALSNNNRAKTPTKYNKTFEEYKRKETKWLRSKTPTELKMKSPTVQLTAEDLPNQMKIYQPRTRAKSAETVQVEDENIEKELEFINFKKIAQTRYSLRPRPDTVMAIHPEKEKEQRKARASSAKRYSVPKKEATLCLVCNKTFAKSSIYRHMKRHQNKKETYEDQDKDIKCFDCGVNFTSDRMLCLHRYRCHN